MGINSIRPKRPLLRMFNWGVVLSILYLLVISCAPKKTKSDIDIEFVQDTLHLGYTYWWPESGPFIGNCGDELSLVFAGNIVQLDDPSDDPGPLYTAQKGIVALEKVFKIKDLGENSYANQKFMTADCFFDSGLSVGDTVLVFCYDYEGKYSIPGKTSILKISSFEDETIKSIKAYIDADENPLAIRTDIELWEQQSLGHKLEMIIECRNELKSLENQMRQTE
ncbi:MAG: hypothetical protein WBM83_02190 [Flavobacteriaceae bacterium]